MSAAPTAKPGLQALARRLDALRRRNLGRELRPLERGAEPWIEVEGRSLLNLSSNNYLGLATHPDLIAASTAATQAHGVGSGSARLIAGNGPLHGDLERRLAAFKRVQSALVFTSGYTANLGLIPALVGAGDVVFADELNHASLIDGCRLSRATVRTYGHRDVAGLREQLALAPQNGHAARRLVVTDSVFSMDGDLAPLADIADLCEQHNCLLMLDEAHATGCLGPGGRGLAAQVGVESAVDVAMGTLSKAVGSFGAFAAGSQLLVDYLVNTARSFLFTTALPPSIVSASLAAIDVIEREPWRQARLEENGRALREGLRSLGLDTLASASHIVPVAVGESARALAMAAALRGEGVFAVAIRPPTVPAGQARIRASVMATHNGSDVELALRAFAAAARAVGLLPGSAGLR